MAELVTLQFHLRAAEGDTSATLYYVSADGEEHRYAEIAVGGSHSQDTYAGHKWLLRGKETGTALATIEAAAQPSLQNITIDGAAIEGAADPTGAPPAGAAAGGFGLLSVEEAEAEAVDAAAGAWLSANGAHRFERVARAAGQPRSRVLWRELGPDGAELGQYVQLAARVDTRWLWWASVIWRILREMSGETAASDRSPPAQPSRAALPRSP